tara:strand:+ start:203 stop:430 length:228 start_codon:yes stop_codon:yes gene_type:complete
MNNTGQKILIALETMFDSQEKKAEAILFNYLNNSVGIGEHPDVVEEAGKQIEVIEHARHCKEIVSAFNNFREGGD